MVEQPFDLDFVPGENPELDEKWIEVKRAFNELDIQVYADESISDESDIV